MSQPVPPPTGNVVEIKLTKRTKGERIAYLTGYASGLKNGVRMGLQRHAAGVSWYCDQCHVEVRQLRCPHCGKSEQEKK